MYQFLIFLTFLLGVVTGIQSRRPVGLLIGVLVGVAMAIINYWTLFGPGRKLWFLLERWRPEITEIGAKQGVVNTIFLAIYFGLTFAWVTVCCITTYRLTTLFASYFPRH